VGLDGLHESTEAKVGKKSIVIGCDNAAIPMKKTLIGLLEAEGFRVENMGCDSPDDPVNYPAIAKRVCEAIIASGFEKRGVLVCGTGIGMAMTANKFKGIRAAVCHDNFSAERSVLSNNANVLCMGERVIGHELAKKIAREWIALEFKDGPSTPKVQEICAIEAENMK
jgi:ribose 5-phosphate isomerase B